MIIHAYPSDCCLRYLCKKMRWYLSKFKFLKTLSFKFWLFKQYATYACCCSYLYYTSYEQNSWSSRNQDKILYPSFRRLNCNKQRLTMITRKFSWLMTLFCEFRPIGLGTNSWTIITCEEYFRNWNLIDLSGYPSLFLTQLLPPSKNPHPPNIIATCVSFLLSVIMLCVSIVLISQVKWQC